MRGLVPVESASASIDERIKELGDWRGKILAKVRAIIHDADPEIVEEWKWVKPTNPGTPVWTHDGIVCTGETYKNAVSRTKASRSPRGRPSSVGVVAEKQAARKATKVPGRRRRLRARLRRRPLSVVRPTVEAMRRLVAKGRCDSSVFTRPLVPDAWRLRAWCGRHSTSRRSMGR
jgi:hypothetical protein